VVGTNPKKKLQVVSPRIFMTMTMTMNSDGSEMGSNGPMGQWANGDGFPNESVYEQLS
jgi:hypothetical protein